MNHVCIPGTTLNPSVICLGTSAIGSAIDRDRSYALLDAYLELGGNFLDTAKIYADWLPGEKSASEKTIGRWMDLRGNRSRVIVGTKGASLGAGPNPTGRLARAEIEGDLDLSLQNLRTETIDLYWLHRDDPNRPVEDILETLNDQVKAGKIRYFGCSNWRVDRIEAARDCARRRGFMGFVANQMMWSYATVNPGAVSDKTMVGMDDAMHRFHAQTGMAAIPYSAQAQGWFQRVAQNTVDKMDPAAAAKFRNPVNDRRFQRLAHLAKETGWSVSNLVLAYLTSQPFTTIPIVGCGRLEQLEDSMKAGDVRLTREQLAYLEQDDAGA